MAGEKRKTINAWLSMWALIVRSCFYKILVVLTVLVCLEGFLLYWNLHRAGGYSMGFMMHSRVFIAALWAVFSILVWMGNMLDTQGRYTLMRLRVTQTQFFFLKLVFHILCFAVLFAVQTGMAFWMAWLYIEKGGYGGDTGQSMFLLFYMDEFLHCLLPMAETGKWVRNFLMVLVFSMEAADSAGKKYYWVYGLCFALTAFCFVSPIGYNSLDIVCDVAYCIGIIVLTVKLWNKWRKDPCCQEGD